MARSADSIAAVTARLTIAYDSSPAAATAVGAAAALFPGARASVVTVSAPPPTSAAMLQQVAPTLSPGSVQSTIDELWAEVTEGARAMAEEGVARAAAHGLQAEVATVPPHASTWEALLAAAHDEGADVLVCGARGRSGFSRTLLGSTSTSLLHHAELPLLVVPDGSGTLDGPVLIAYDGSEAAKQAIDGAGRVLSGRPALVVHVWESQFRHGLTMRVLARGAVAEHHRATRRRACRGGGDDRRTKVSRWRARRAWRHPGRRSRLRRAYGASWLRPRGPTTRQSW